MCWNISAIVFALKICRGAKKISEFPFFYVRNLLKFNSCLLQNLNFKLRALPDSPAPWSMLRQQKFCWTISARWHNPSAYWSGLVISTKSLENSATMETGGFTTGSWFCWFSEARCFFAVFSQGNLKVEKDYWNIQKCHRKHKQFSKSFQHRGNDRNSIMSPQKSWVISYQCHETNVIFDLREIIMLLGINSFDSSAKKIADLWYD